MNFKKIVFFVSFVLPSALFTSDHTSKKLKVENIYGITNMLDRKYEEGDLLDLDCMPVQLYSSDSKLDYLHLAHNPAYKVLAAGKANLDCLYVLNLGSVEFSKI